MSDAMIKSPVQCRPYYAWSSFWGGIDQKVSTNTCLTGYADGSGKVRFLLPLGSWEFALCAMYVVSSFDLVYSLLDPDAASQTIQIRSERDPRLAVVTDEWGNAALEISGDISEGVTGGAAGVIRFTRADTGHLAAYRGQPNLPWNAAATPEHRARLIDMAPPELVWDAEQFYNFREYRATMASAMEAAEGAYPHHPHPALVPYVDDGSYAWLSVPNACGASPFCVTVDNGTDYTVYAATHSYEKTVGSDSRTELSQSFGPAIRQKKGSAPCMGLARLPVYPKRYSPGVSDPPFIDTFASEAYLPAQSTHPWFLPAFITVEDGVAYANLRIPFQNIPHSMGWKDDDGYSWTTAVHEGAGPLERPALLLMRDGSSANLLSGITLEGTGGSGSTVLHDAGGITLHARLSSVPSIGEHACFVRCQGAYLVVNSPAANGNGDAPAEEERFKPYV